MWGGRQMPGTQGGERRQTSIKLGPLDDRENTPDFREERGQVFSPSAASHTSFSRLARGEARRLLCPQPASYVAVKSQESPLSGALPQAELEWAWGQPGSLQQAEVERLERA